MCDQNANTYETKLLFSVARNKTATISPDAYDVYHKPSNAVDGDKVCVSYKSIAASMFAKQPWLLIQLNATYNIENVIIYARRDTGLGA